MAKRNKTKKISMGESVYYDRKLKKEIKKLMKGFPIVSVTGPRQSGKTTFLQHNFPNYKYFNLENPLTLAMIREDVKGFLNDNPTKIIIDEVQRMPELLSYLQVHVDEMQAMGGIFISGSQNLLVSDKISQSLAGRAGYKVLYPFSLSELKTAELLGNDVFTQILKGGYPSMYTRDIDAQTMFGSYIATYLERDVRAIKEVTNLAKFQKFMQLLAGRVGQILNTASLANDVGIAPNTAEDWISILEASYIVFRLQPYYKNINKRLIKSPKIYFNDTGLLCALLRIDTRTELKSHYAIGGIFENYIITEIIKEVNNKGVNAQLYFYRDSHGNEVDLVIDHGLKQVPIEIKSASGFHPDALRGLKYWRENIDEDASGYLINSGNDKRKVGKDKLLPWFDLSDVSME